MWPGVMGEFMIYFPITLSVVLGSSLFVAIFINSVMVSQFMEVDEEELSIKQLIIISAILGGIGILIFIFGGSIKGLGTLMIVTAILFWAYKYGISKVATYFQKHILVRWENWYEKAIRFALDGWKPYLFTIGTVLLLVVSVMLFGKSIESKRTKIEFFPDNTPNQIIVYIEYPQGTDIEKTNELTKSIEQRVYAVLNDDEYMIDGTNFMTESAVSQVGEGAQNPFTDSGINSEMPHRAKITATMVEFKFRKKKDSEILRKRIQDALTGIYPGVAISVEKDAIGPPVGYPINIEIKGDNYNELIATAEKMRDFINSKSIAGIAELKIDVNKGKPAMQIEVDREKAGEFGVAVGQVGNQLRRSLFGEKAGIYKKDGEDYDIYVRFNEANRYNKSALFNQHIIFRDQASGKIKEIPITAVTKQKNTSTFSAIKHRNLGRVVLLYSGMSPGFTDASAIVKQIEAEMASFEDKPIGVEFDFTGQIEEEKKQMSFLMGALLTGLGLIFFILIFQFNSVSKPAIIMIAIFLSFIGVFLGLVGTGWSFVIMMTMMGIISLAGIVVNNGVVLLDYIQLLIDRKKAVLGVPNDKYLTNEYVKEAIIQGGKARLRPVLLTAITTVLGLIPLAIGFNLDFFSLFSEFDPKIYVGGDNVVFWGPLAWTVIFGLIFATFLTLIIVPVLFYLVKRIKDRVFKHKVVEVQFEE